MRLRVPCWIALSALASAPPSVRGQSASRIVVLAQGHVFAPLRADPKQPGFFAAYLWASAVQRDTRLASVGMGEDIGLVRDTAGRWQLSISAGVFSQFDMHTPSYDLLNTDFVVGIPFAWRSGPLALRARLYHQSSHLGDEYLLHSGATRVNFSYESLEVLGARQIGLVRVYGGGEQLLRRDPPNFRPLVLHGGIEVARDRPQRLGSLGRGAPFVALDAKSSEERHWRVGWGLRTGVEFATTAPGARRWTVALYAYQGPSPYGQFYETDVRALGIGVGFGL
jgi:uncharacterized protein DUF1207